MEMPISALSEMLEFSMELRARGADQFADRLENLIDRAVKERRDLCLEVSLLTRASMQARASGYKGTVM